jgi:peptidoglycan/LPS O-acetylase OafA/YrhL
METKKIHFKGLNYLRAIAALSVVFHHIELYKSNLNISGLYDTKWKIFINSLGKNGVYLFFVLSGFLITYLLFSEKKTELRINVRKFYLRRILRIWPLYYLIFLISFLFLPILVEVLPFLKNDMVFYSKIIYLRNHYFELFILFLFFLPNLALLRGGSVAGASQTWSVGVEEQFYLLWPWIIKSSGKYFLFSLFFLIAFLYPNLHNILLEGGFQLNLHWFKDMVQLFPIHFMAMGAIVALIQFEYGELAKRFLFNKIVFPIAVIFVISLLFFPGHSIIFGISCAFLILSIINSEFSFTNKWVNKLGVISYGIYMFHPILMFITFGIINTFIPLEKGLFMYNLFLYSIIFIFTIGVSLFSYKYFESRFLNMKNKFN